MAFDAAFNDLNVQAELNKIKLHIERLNAFDLLFLQFTKFLG